MWIHRGQTGIWLAIAAALIALAALWWRRKKAPRDC
jgi:LPXTG-motif cell wall-anchored protein